MGQDPQIALLSSGLFTMGSQSRSKTTLEPRKDALGLPTLVIGLLRKAFFHLPTIWSCRSDPFTTPIIDRYDRAADTKYFTTKLLVPLAIVSCIAQQLLNRQATYRLPDRWWQIRRIITRCHAHHRPSDQMASVMTDNSQLGPITVTLGAFALTQQVVAADELTVQTGSVDGGFGMLLDQTTQLCSVKNGLQETLKSPFFTRRC